MYLPVIDLDPLRRAILDGSEYERWQLAGREDLPDWAYRLLFQKRDTSVLASLTQNASCPPDVLDDIARSEIEDLSTYARLNPNAWPNTKDPSPLGRHSTRSVDLYLIGRGATQTQRLAFASIHRQSTPDSTLTVEGAWRAARDA